MLWACMHFPLLCLETVSRADPGEAPLAVAAGGTRPRIIAVDAIARLAGIRPGMAVSAALALAPGLSVQACNPALEAQALREIAQWALQFSPAISLSGPDAVVLEIGAGLKLFGGLAPLLRSIHAELPALGFSAVVAAAPTATAALMLARSNRAQAITDAAVLRDQLAPLPAAATGCSEDVVQTLAELGVHTVGALLGLPRDGLARRFGQMLLDTLDRALGRLPDPQPPFLAPEQFCARLELPAPAWEVEALLFGVKRLIASLGGWLRGRGLGAMRLRLELVHGDCAPTTLRLNLSAPSRDAMHLGGLMRERLERTRLPDRVEAIVLAADESAVLDARDLPLFPGVEAADESQLIERLCARLGDEAICALRPCADHRPELAWRAERPAQAANAIMPPGPRPLWLLAEPQPLDLFLHEARAPVVLMDGPERIESGWWEDLDVRRDYFVARAQGGQTLWIFRQAGSGTRWYVHGIFA